MNREIKFRMWNDYDKKMIHWNELLEKNLANIFTIPSYNKWLMQYIELHDKNGKEIYEGDIVKITENILKQKVIRLKPIIADIEWSEEYLTYILITTSVKDAFESLTDYLDEYDIEVIGNIYDNPELLGGE